MKKSEYQLFVDGRATATKVSLDDLDAEVINRVFREDPPDDFRREYRKVSRSQRSSIFVAVRRAVMRGSEMVAQAKSATFARRIANALNRHTPNEKGY